MARAAARPTWLSVADVVADLGVSDETVYGWLRSGELKSKRYGRLYRIRSDWYAAWCEGRPDGERAPEQPVRAAPAASARPAKVERLINIAENRRLREAAQS